MRPEVLKILPALCVCMALQGCSSEQGEAHFDNCRDEGVRAFNARLQDQYSRSVIRWVQDCMEKHGYKRVYAAGQCQKLDASVTEPECYAKTDAQL